MLSTNPLLAAVAAPPIGQAARWAAAYDGRHGPLINLSQAVPGHAPPAFLAEALARAGGDEDASRYGPVLGDDHLRGAYAAEMSRLYDAKIEPGETAITAGCNQAFFAAAVTLARAGEAIVLPRPAYFNHQMTLAMLGIEARDLPTHSQNGFVPTAADVEAVLDDKVRAVALVTPNNPTGAIYPARVIDEIAALCRRRGVFLILDETYRDFRAGGNVAPHGVFARTDWRDFLVELYSFSKSYAVPGHRLGAMVAGPAILAEAAKVIDCLQICAPRGAQQAIAAAIEETRSWRAEKTDEILERAAVFRQTMAPLAERGWAVEQIGAYFAYVRHPYPDVSATVLAEALASRLGVVALPGSFFGAGQERHMRIAFANVASERIVGLAERLGLADALFETAELAG